MQLNFSKARLLAAVSISLLTLALFLPFSDLDYFVNNPVKSWGWFSVGLAAYMLNMLIRAVRLNLIYQQYFGHKLCLWSAVCGFYSSLNFLLPARLGEFSLPLLIQRFFGEKILDNAPVVISLRVLDIGALFLIAGFAALVVGYTEWMSGIGQLVWIIGVVLIGLVIVFCVPLIRQFISEKIGLVKDRFSGHLGEISLISFMLAGMFFLQVVATAMALGSTNAFVASLTIYVFSVITRLVPADGLANIGSHHLAWFAALTLAGIPRDEAMSTAIASHLIFVSFVVIGGIVAGALFFIGKRNEKISG